MEHNPETLAIVALVLLVIGLIAISLKLNSENEKLEEKVQNQTHLASIFSKESQERNHQLTELRMDLLNKQKKISHLEELLADLSDLKVKNSIKESKEELKNPSQSVTIDYRNAALTAPPSRNKRK